MDPKLPYQAVMIRQSAMLQEDSECHSAEKAVWVLTVQLRSAGDRSLLCGLMNAKASQDGREYVPQLLGASTSFHLLV